MNLITKIPLTLSLCLLCVCNLLAIQDDSNYHVQDSLLQRVRIDFKSPTDFTRHLLLSFTTDDSATDGYDNGYDASNIDSLPYDLNWMIEDKHCIIQGVGSYDEQKFYPLILFMSTEGNIEISLVGLENFETEIPVYIYDSTNEQFVHLNEVVLTDHVEEGNFENRYFIAFSNDNRTLSSINYYHDAHEILVYGNDKDMLTIRSNHSPISEIKIYSLDGKLLHDADYADLTRVNIENSELGNAMYILKVKLAERYITKVIVLR